MSYDSDSMCLVFPRSRRIFYIPRTCFSSFLEEYLGALKVKNFQKNTRFAVKELLEASGLTHPRELNRRHIVRRLSESQIKLADQIYPKVGLCILCTYMLFLYIYLHMIPLIYNGINVIQYAIILISL